MQHITNQLTSQVYDSTALIALGSNQPSMAGSPEETLRCATNRITALLGSITGKSAFYITPCFPAGFDPDFVNAVVSVRTSRLPSKVLMILHEIEAEFGRKRDTRWGQRTLDLDLIGLGAAICPDVPTFETQRHLPPEHQKTTVPDDLILPHPRLQDRAFVLVPLCDVAPDWIHPVLGQTAIQMRDALSVHDLAGVQPLPSPQTESSSP